MGAVTSDVVRNGYLKRIESTAELRAVAKILIETGLLEQFRVAKALLYDVV